ncbi:bifunctional polysaccharide deacetylase/glycosyltransferase family 2 protein [Longispora albida]|uniref:bifunctional polysaccharide deacetylase/glycosyltransferase family 2 protein n=1 Tax=Longispora albida TaxID=203523 RepID=UPI0003A9CEB9|nr:bifunctional polysaccharide deacetylase/glycosyltransferase family 2 protein [Longispora albida]
MLTLLAALSLHGYSEHWDGKVTAQNAGKDGPAAAWVTGGGPVLRGDGTSRKMPEKTLALTFDDGPDPAWTPQVLDVLRRHGAHATFFVVGRQAGEHSGLAERIVTEGHEIGSHTYSHASLAGLPSWQRELELNLADNAIAGATGRRPVLFRPPYSSTPGAVSVAEWTAYRDNGHLLVLADLDTRDWERPGADAIVRNATPQGTAGAVVLMHDAGGDRSQTVAALDRLLPQLKARGYRFTTVSEGLGLPGMAGAGLGTKSKGVALATAQQGAGGVVSVLEWLLAIGLGLGTLRAVVQFGGAWLHRRRSRRKRSRPVMHDPVSVIVPAYNEAANIGRTVRSLLASNHPVEVIVVDDGSADNTAEIAYRAGAVVLRQANAGKPAALNNGITHARYDLLVLVDGDTVFEPDAVHNLVQPFADPGVGAVSGNTKVGNRDGLLGRWQHIEYVMGFNLDRRLFDIAQCMPTVPGAIGAFRREALGRGVPTDTLAEDTDLTMAICRAGWRVAYEPTARAWTEVPASMRQLWRQRYRWCYGTLQAMWKHRAAITAGGQAGKLGRRGLVYLLLFQTLLPLAAPAVDVFAIYGLVFLDPWRIAAMWLGAFAVQFVLAGYALLLDGERLRTLWSLPLQQVGYRQLMYLVTVQSVVTAVAGARLGWQRMHRIGAAGQALDDARAGR